MRARRGAGATEGSGRGALCLHGQGELMDCSLGGDKGKLDGRTWRTRLSNQIFSFYMY